MKTRGSGAMVAMVFLLIGASATFLASTGRAATITVKQLGGGNYTTISAAISYAQQDDTIMVYAGRYEGSLIINKNLKLIGVGPQWATIYGDLDGITVNSNVEATIMGFTITSGKSGIVLKSSSRTIIKNNCIVTNGMNGIYLDDADSLIINNVISANGKSGIATNNYYLSSANPNIINNIIVNNGEYGLYLPYANEVILHNDVFSNIAGNYTNSSPGTGDISQNPQFMDANSGNFALRSTDPKSPCINAGRPGSADADPDGSRNDMGAYGGPDAAAFWPYPPGAPIITNLTATPTSVPKGGTITINATGEVR
jgi:parallel beta-helix repeat protein